MAQRRIDLWTVVADYLGMGTDFSFYCPTCEFVTQTLPPCRPLSRPMAEAKAADFNLTAERFGLPDKFKAVPIPSNIGFVYCVKHAPPSAH